MIGKMHRFLNCCYLCGGEPRADCRFTTIEVKLLPAGNPVEGLTGPIDRVTVPICPSHPSWEHAHPTVAEALIEASIIEVREGSG